MDAHHFEEAESKAKALTEQIPRSFRAWFLLGNAAFFATHYDEAVQAYQQSIAIQPGAATTWQNLGVSLDRLGRPTEDRSRLPQIPANWIPKTPSPKPAWAFTKWKSAIDVTPA